MKKDVRLNIFVFSDNRSLSEDLLQFLTQYENYQVHFIPTAMELFEVMKWEPDIMVLDSQAEKVVKCYEWAA